MRARRSRADTASLFSRLAVVEDLGRICKTLASLGRPDAAAECGAATAFAKTISVEPSHAFPRAFLAAAWTAMGEAYETLARHRATVAADRLDYPSAALDRHRRSFESWSDLKGRGLVSPVDTGRISAAERARARGQRLIAASTGSAR